MNPNVFPNSMNLDTNQEAQLLQMQMQADAEALGNAVQFARNAVQDKFGDMLKCGTTPAWVDVSAIFDAALATGKVMEARIRHEFEQMAKGYEVKMEDLSRRQKLGGASRGPIALTPNG